jgi:hypothetical protein
MTYTQVWDHMQNQVSDRIIVRDEDDAFIPFDPDNVDYQDYLAWLDEGNQPNECIPPAMTLPANPSIDERVDDLETRVDALESEPATMPVRR